MRAVSGVLRAQFTMTDACDYTDVVRKFGHYSQRFVAGEAPTCYIRICGAHGNCVNFGFSGGLAQVRKANSILPGIRPIGAVADTRGGT